jgi:hypothetical protein
MKKTLYGIAIAVGVWLLTVLVFGSLYISISDLPKADSEAKTTRIP